MLVSSTSISSRRFLPAGVQVGAVAAEGVDGFVEITPAHSGEGGRLPGAGIGPDCRPKGSVQRNARIEGAHLRLHGVEGGAQFRVGGHGLEVPHHAHGVIERLGDVVQRAHGVFEGTLARKSGDGFDSGARAAQQFGCGGPHVFGMDFVERDPESNRKKWILHSIAGHHTKGYQEPREQIRGWPCKKLQNRYHRVSMDLDNNGGGAQDSACPGVYALVIYIPEPLGRFLDELRRELIPGYNPHAHVSVLPPRTLPVGSEVVASEQVRAVAERSPAFDVELCGIGVFPETKVIYIEVGKGAVELRQMHDDLNKGTLVFDEAHRYHPHVTLAQDFPAERVEELRQAAEERWRNYLGTRTFRADRAYFVHSLCDNCWKDLNGFEIGGALVS